MPMLKCLKYVDKICIATLIVKGITHQSYVRIYLIKSYFQMETIRLIRCLSRH